jgi:hypothetical protein
VIVSGPYAGTARILTHERVHAEMKSWLPYDSLPTWFNEGVATVIAHEPDCSSQPQLSMFDITQLDTKAKWQAHIRNVGTLTTYCQARDRVAAWAEGAALAPALRQLMTSVANGEPFATALRRRF